jgi:hypothetical protein
MPQYLSLLTEGPSSTPSKGLKVMLYKTCDEQGISKAETGRCVQYIGLWFF